MSKALTQYIPPSTIQPPHSNSSLIYADLQSGTAGVASDIQDSIAVAQSNVQAGNFAFGLGVAISKTARAIIQSTATKVAYQVLDHYVLSRFKSNKAGSAIQNKPAPTKPSNAQVLPTKVAELNRKLGEKNVRIRIHIDPDAEGNEVTNDMLKMSETFLKQLELATKEGPKTNALVEQCIAGVRSFDLYHAKWTKKFLKSHPQLSSNQAAYSPSQNIMALIGSESSSMIHNIVHECWHAKEHLDANWKESGYDADKIDTCNANLKKTLQTAVDCFEGKTAKGCNEIKELAEHYKNRPFVDNTAATPPGSAVSFSYLESIKRPLSGLVVFLKIDDGLMSSFIPHFIQASGKNYLLTQQQKNLMNMVWNLDGLHTREQMQKAYNAEEFLSEYHANTVERVPESVLDQVCPGGFRQSVKDSRAKTAAPLKYEL